MKNLTEEPKQIKCYCGHTTTCDCSPLEPKQETLEEAAKKLYPITGEYFNKEFYMVKRLAFIEGANWQQEQDNKELAMWKLAVEKQEARCITLRGVISDLQKLNDSCGNK
jgi:hypothetical protein